MDHVPAAVYSGKLKVLRVILCAGKRNTTSCESDLCLHRDLQPLQQNQEVKVQSWVSSPLTVVQVAAVAGVTSQLQLTGFVEGPARHLRGKRSAGLRTLKSEEVYSPVIKHKSQSGWTLPGTGCSSPAVT